MRDIPQAFPKLLEDLQPTQTLVAAVSGGRDSMALLELLAENRRNVVVAHFNHELRGAESDGDEAFVRAEAVRRGVIFRGGSGNARAAAKGVSVEMAARELRHRFFAQVAREFSADVALAHHADDQIELFFMRLLRGVEGPGLAGMRSISPSPADSGVRILRPLLYWGREDLKSFAQKRKIRFREDSSNAELHADRNRVRHLIIPAMRAEAGVDFQRVMLRHIESIRNESDSARFAAKLWLEKSEAFQELPLRLQREVIAIQLEQASIPVTVERIAALQRKMGARVSLGPKRTASLDARGRLQVFGELWPESSLQVDLSKEAKTTFSGSAIEWRLIQKANTKPTPNKMVFDADAVGEKIVLRHWQQGDRIQLSGRASIRPLHEMFSRNKVPRAERHKLIVATTTAGEIFWVEGLRITEKFKINPHSRRFLEWRWTRE